MAIRNLARNKRRNIATGSAIALGFAAMVALSGYLNRVHNYLRVYTIYGTRTGHITVYKTGGLENNSIKPWAFSLTKAEQGVITTALSDLPNVDFHGGQLIGNGLVGNGCKTLPFIASGIPPELDQKLRAHPEMDRWSVNLKDYKKGRAIAEYPAELGAVALSEGLARLLGKHKVHDDFPKDSKAVLITDCLAPDVKEKFDADANVQLVSGTWSGMMSAVDGEVVGHYNTGVTETNSSALFTSLEYLQKLYDTENVSYYSIWLKDPQQLPITMAELEKRLAGKGTFSVYPWTDDRMSPFFNGTMQFLYVMIGFISFVLATVIVFSISNSATMTIIERSQEIGMMRSLGFARTYIRALFIREMVALAILSVIVGGLIGVTGIMVINGMNIRFNPPGVAGGMQLVLKPSALMVGSAAVVIFSLAAGAAWIAIRSIVQRNIAILLMGSHR